LHADNVDTIYPKLIRSIIENGKPAGPRGMPVREIYDVGFKINDGCATIITSPHRKVNMAYMAIEMLGLLRHGKKNVEPYLWYNSQMAKYLNPKTGEWDGSYATRLTTYDQMRKVYKILKADPHSRRAILSFYNPAHDKELASLDHSCTLNLIFRLRDGKLHLTSTMRSNDVMLGVPYDFSQFSFLLSVLACWLEVGVGTFYYFVANLHAYEKDIAKLKIIADAPWPKAFEVSKWTHMRLWDIPDVEETFAQVERFFCLEYAMRQLKKIGPPQIETLIHDYKITSEVLKSLLRDVLWPYVTRKLKIS